MSESSAAFVVASSLRVPGLGVLAIPANPVPLWLAQHALHTGFAFTLLVEGHLPQSLTGTIEELAHHEGEAPYRTLLLDFNPLEPLAAGSHLQVKGLTSQLL